MALIPIDDKMTGDNFSAAEFNQLLDVFKDAVYDTNTNSLQINGTTVISTTGFMGTANITDYINTLPGLDDVNITGASNGEVLKYDSGNWVNGTVAGGGGAGGAPVTPNIVYVDPDSSEVTGEVYTTWSDADTYVATQSPSSTNRWTIKISGNNSENIVQRNYVTIDCNGGRLTGSITSDMTVLTADNGGIINGIITDATGTAGRLSFFRNCKILGGTFASSSLFIVWRSYISGVDGTASTVSQFFTSTINSGTFDAACNFENCWIYDTVSSTFSGFLASNSLVALNGSNTYNAGEYNLKNCVITGNLTPASGSTINLRNCSEGTVTYNAGVTLNVSGYFNGTIAGGAGTLNDTGMFYDNGTSGLTATNTKAAIDELESSKLADIVNDTTPQLGGELDCQANSIGFTAQSATGDGSTTINWGLGNKFNFTFGAFNETFTFTNPAKPGNFTLKLVQDSVGSRTATWPASVKWVGGIAPTLTTTATTGTDIVSFYFDGTNYWGAASLDFS